MTGDEGLFKNFFKISSIIIKHEQKNFFEYLKSIDDYTFTPPGYRTDSLLQEGTAFLLEFQKEFLFQIAQIVEKSSQSDNLPQFQLIVKYSQHIIHFGSDLLAHIETFAKDAHSQLEKQYSLKE